MKHQTKYGTCVNQDEKIPILHHSDSDLSSVNTESDFKIIGMCRSNFLFCLYILSYIAFLCSSAALFCYMERPEEVAVILKFEAAREAFLRAHPSVTDKELALFINEVVEAAKKGVVAASNSSYDPNWTLAQSIFFASTVVTTIGYGHITPLSKGGKMFCVLYALIGIPLTLVLLSAFVERLLKPTVAFLHWLNSRLGHIHQPLTIRLMHLFIICCIMSIFIIIIPSAIFGYIEEEWDFWDAFYYCFISLTTIGLGDYIPGDDEHVSYRSLYKIITTVYLYVGIAVMMLILTLFYEIPQLNFGTFLSDDVSVEKLQFANISNDQYGSTSIPDQQNTHRQVVRVRSRRNDDDDDDDSPNSAPPFKDYRLP